MLTRQPNLSLTRLGVAGACRRDDTGVTGGSNIESRRRGGLREGPTDGSTRGSRAASHRDWTEDHHRGERVEARYLTEDFHQGDHRATDGSAVVDRATSHRGLAGDRHQELAESRHRQDLTVTRRRHGTHQEMAADSNVDAHHNATRAEASDTLNASAQTDGRAGGGGKFTHHESNHQRLCGE